MEEIIERANATNYGLAAGVITKDIEKALMFSQVWFPIYIIKMRKNLIDFDSVFVFIFY